MDEDSLVTAAEVARVMGLRDAQVVLDLRKHQVGFPEPIGRRDRSLVWSWPDVRSWATARGAALAGALGVALAAFLEPVQ